MSVTIYPSAARIVGREAREEAAGQFAEECMGVAMDESPVQTGHLRDSHVIAKMPGRKLLINVAFYSYFVHEGHRIVSWGNETNRRRRPNRWLLRARDRVMNRWQ